MFYNIWKISIVNIINNNNFYICSKFQIRSFSFFDVVDDVFLQEWRSRFMVIFDVLQV